MNELPSLPSPYRLPSLQSVGAEKARRKLIDFTQFTYPAYDAGWFHKEVAARLDTFLEDVVAQKSPRLILEAPPRHGKTELVSRRFPAFALGKCPDLSIIATSYNNDLASRNNRDVQRIIDDPVYEQLFPKTKLWGANVRTNARGTWLRNNDIFEVVNQKGVYRSAGVMGGITGMGAHIFLIDDPVKDQLEAESQTYRDRLWEWFASTAYTRLAPGGGILIIQTRWHEDDLSGRILERSKLPHSDDPATLDRWQEVKYPALAEQDEPHRKKEEALHPARYDEKALQRIKHAVGDRVWISLFQQRPTAAEGAIFKRGHEQYIYPGNIDGKDVQQWASSLDAAVKEKETNDFSCSLVGAQFNKGILIRSRIHGRMPYPQLREAVKLQAEQYPLSALLVEDKSAGQQIIQELQQTTSLPVRPVEPQGDKVARGWVVVPTWEANRVYFPCDADGVPEPWVEHFLNELFSFPNGAHDDQVDAFTQLLHYFTLSGGGRGLLDFYQQQLDKEDIERKSRQAEEEMTKKIEYINLLGATRPGAQGG